MPKKVHRCATKLMKKGKSKSSAWAICYAAQKKKKKGKKK